VVSKKKKFKENVIILIVKYFNQNILFDNYFVCLRFFFFNNTQESIYFLSINLVPHWLTVIFGTFLYIFFFFVSLVNIKSYFDLSIKILVVYGISQCFFPREMRRKIGSETLPVLWSGRFCTLSFVSTLRVPRLFEKSKIIYCAQPNIAYMQQ